jgi:hypothetical protein
VEGVELFVILQFNLIVPSGSDVDIARAEDKSDQSNCCYTVKTPLPSRFPSQATRNAGDQQGIKYLDARVDGDVESWPPYSVKDQ